MPRANWATPIAVAPASAKRFGDTRDAQRPAKGADSMIPSGEDASATPPIGTDNPPNRSR